MRGFKAFTARLMAMLTLTGMALTQAQAETIVIFGASGRIGGEIMQEALSRGHEVIGVSRSPEKFTVDHPNFKGMAGDVTDPDSFRALVEGADGVVISVQGNSEDNDPKKSTHAVAAKVAVEVLTGVEDAPYVLEIGGATTLVNDPELMLESMPFPAEPGTPMRGMIFGHWEALVNYRASTIDWTVLTPPLQIVNEGPRTGVYRTSTDGAVRDAEGQSRVSRADLAVAAVDEIEKRQFVGRRFTVGY